MTVTNNRDRCLSDAERRRHPPDLHGRPDAPDLDRVAATATAEDGTAISRSFTNTPPAVGDTLTIPCAGEPGSDHVVVVAELVDGSRQVVLDVAV